MLSHVVVLGLVDFQQDVVGAFWAPVRIAIQPIPPALLSMMTNQVVEDVLPRAGSDHREAQWTVEVALFAKKISRREAYICIESY